MKRYDIIPVPKPRQTRADKWKKRPAVLRYRAFADHVRALKICVPEEDASITFVMPMPKTWSAKKKQEHDGLAHQQKPDLDNLIKALLDSIYGDDSVVWHLSAKKIWGYVGAIHIDIPEIQPL